jgi:hypothetical protein
MTPFQFWGTDVYLLAFVGRKTIHGIGEAINHHKHLAEDSQRGSDAFFPVVDYCC